MRTVSTTRFGGKVAASSLLPPCTSRESSTDGCATCASCKTRPEALRGPTTDSSVTARSKLADLLTGVQAVLPGTRLCAFLIPGAAADLDSVRVTGNYGPTPTVPLATTRTEAVGR